SDTLYVSTDRPFVSTNTSNTPYVSTVSTPTGANAGESSFVYLGLWIQNQMMDYDFNFMNTKIHIDNESTISVIKNPVAHSRTKHIEI
ncbi:hypothetical protein Tco_0416672, partial [Tanacetum coccineum]